MPNDPLHTLAETILRDAEATLQSHVERIPDAHRDIYRAASKALAKYAVRQLQNPTNDDLTEAAAARAILANLRATGHILAANALRDALTSSLRTAASIIGKL